jgi:hypothetical protein
VESSEAGPALSFDRAEYTGSAESGPPCANCARPLGEQYWQWQAKPICESCRGGLSALLAESQSQKAFARAALLGGATALGSGVAYAVFVALTHYQLALVTIGIAFLIAKVMRRCSGGIGGRKYQILAVVLTYLASAMGYAPGVYAGFRSAASEQEAGPHATVAPAANGAPATDHGSSGDGRPGAGAFVAAFAMFLAFTLAAPILAATEAPIGLLIVGFGLWEAWKLLRGLPISLDGPYRATAATGPPAG